MNENALIRKWSWLAEGIAIEFFHPKIDRDDFRQEALIGVMEALRRHDSQRGPLKQFIALCVRRRLIEMLRAEGKMKRDWRREMREVVTEDGEVLQTVDILPALNADPCELIQTKDNLAGLAAAMTRLSPLEHRAVVALVNDEHPHAGGIDKQLDNALLRARAKLRLAA